VFIAPEEIPGLKQPSLTFGANFPTVLFKSVVSMSCAAKAGRMFIPFSLIAQTAWASGNLSSLYVLRAAGTSTRSVSEVWSSTFASIRQSSTKAKTTIADQKKGIKMGKPCQCHRTDDTAAFCHKNNDSSSTEKRSSARMPRER